MVVLVALLAALAIPTSQKLRQNAIRSRMLNDARQIGSAASQYMTEMQVGSVPLVLASNGVVGPPLNVYVKQIGGGYTCSSPIVANGTFTLANELLNGGTPLTFNAEGQLYTE